MARVIYKPLYRLFSSLENIHWFTKSGLRILKIHNFKKGQTSWGLKESVLEDTPVSMGHADHSETWDCF